MNVISISTDRNIFVQGSAVRQRMIEYGALFAELHIVIFSNKSLRHRPERIAPNVWIYPTRSLSRFLYIRDARSVAAGIIRSKAWHGKDVVVTTQDPFETGSVGVSLKKKYGCALQIQVHTDVASPYYYRHSFINKIRTRLAAANLPLADEVRVVSERIKKTLLAQGIGGASIDVLPIYTDIDAVSSADTLDLATRYPHFSHIVLMACRLEREKNVSFALEVFKEVLKVHPDAGLIIVGSGSLEHQLKAKAQELVINRSVVFAGWQDNLPSWYKGATIFLSTSLYEGYGLSLVEAAAAGLPIVASDAGVAGDLLADGVHALVCPVNDSEAFAGSLTRLIADASKRAELARNAQEAVKNAAIRKPEYLARYRECLEKTTMYSR